MTVTRILAVISVALAITSTAAQQNVTITGRIVDAAGQPPGDVTITAQDAATGSAADATGAIADGSFGLTVPAGIYRLNASALRPPLLPTHLRVDARGGNVSNLVVRMTAQTLLIPDEPPRASLIQVSLPDDAGDATVSGAAGAVTPGSFLILMALDTGYAATTEAASDGSFRAKIFAPLGSSILIKADSLGVLFRPATSHFPNDIGPQFSLLAGTILRVPDPPAGPTGVPFGRTGVVRLSAGPILPYSWTYQGTIGSQVQPGGTLRIEGTLRVESSALQQAGSMTVSAGVRLDQIARPDGAGSLAQNTFASTLLTPTGFPIERLRNTGVGGGFSQHVRAVLVKTAVNRAEANIELTFQLPADLPSGFYVPVATFFFDDMPAEPPPNRLRLTIERSARREVNTTYLPVVRVGSSAAPRLPAMLLTETIANGTRGVRAIEDRSRFGLSSRIRMDDTFIIPRLDGAGQPLPYRLEPFLPTVGLTIAGQPNLPLIPFRFPSGGLTVRIQAPDGSITAIGPAPFVQPRLKSNGLSQTSVRDFNGGFFSRVFTLITECYQLTTLDPRFEVQFAKDGRHVITLDGTIEDLGGNTWTVGGTYEVNVARLLSVGTAVMPGTPLEVGDVLSPAVTVDPGVAADVEVRVRLAPNSDASRMIERTVRGRANRFGQFNPLGSGVLLSEPGEYRVDVVASFVDSQGAHWMGARTWGSVVAPRDTPIVAHGRRGMVNTQVLGTPWFFRTQTPFPKLPDASHPNPPFHSGDVFWAQESDTAFVMFTFQDSNGVVTDLLRNRQRDSGVGVKDPGTFQDREALGELPLFSTRADGTDPHIDPSRVDLWGYTYRFVERPAISVRELVAEDSIPLAYWPFYDPYAGQIGMGGNGDLPNDLKFYLGGAVLHGRALARPLYAGYGSLFVLVPDDDARGGSRVFPPFQGNGGGPSGGPLFTLKGKDIDMFFHPTAMRPGSILHTGETLSFTGHMGPTLPSKVEITISSPSGRQQTVSGIANRVGYFVDSRPNVIVDEPGVWKAKVKTWFDGVLPSTNGQVQPPYPTGDVLGSRSGEFYLYVVDRASDPLQLQPMPRYVRPTDGPITFTLTPPAGLRDVQLAYTTTMPGFILEEGTTSSLLYAYDAKRLRTDFPNLDADAISISFLLSGTDGNGDRRHYARQVVIFGDELSMPEQRPLPPQPRRRAVRH